jgi:sulfide:quinone oxidoreductase
MGRNCALTLATPEETPLELFGGDASRALAARLAQSGVATLTDVHVDVPHARVIELHPGGDRVTVDRIVSLPQLEGPAVEGLPHDAQGFLEVDRHGRLAGVADVYAAGDATSFPIKQGGLACQQADAAAETIAAQAGAAIDPHPYEALLQGVLLTERDATFVRREAEGASDHSVSPAQDLWWPPTKIAGRELSRHIGGPTRHLAPAKGDGVEIRVPVTDS